MNGVNVSIRALEPEDIDLLYSWENDRRIWHLSNTLTPLSRFTLEQYVLSAGQDLYATRQMRLMIDLVKEENGKTTIGSVDLFEFEPAHMRAGVGILIHASYRGKGYASEALQLLINYTFETLHMHQLFANISVDNPESIKLFEKKGFRYIGTKKEWNKIMNQWKDESMFQLINFQDKP
jgi:diamine N-acetyltransferase